MDKIKKFIEGYYFENGDSPSTTKIAEAVGISRAGAYNYLVAMNDRGMIAYANGVIETRSILWTRTARRSVCFFSGRSSRRVCERELHWNRLTERRMEGCSRPGASD